MLKPHKFLLHAIAVMLISTTSFADDDLYDVLYTVAFVPESGYAEVTIEIEDASSISSLVFSLNPEIHTDLEANGRLELGKDSATWTPPESRAELSLRATINNQRDSGSYDALMTDDWTILRGDDLVPPVRVTASRGAESSTHLEFDLPDGWNSVNTGWARDTEATPPGDAVNAPRFIIDNPERRFDRPTGWMIAGKASTRRVEVGNTYISVAAPNDSEFRRMDVLIYLSFVWPELEKAFGEGPEKLLIVGGADPMWRGGLSASNSLFMHADRPLVSENGTSTLLHEVFHMVTRIRGDEYDDWIAEGLAEFYAIELLHRAGGTNDDRKEATYEHLREWSQDITSLRGPRSSGPITAKAVLIFAELDQEIQKHTDGQHSLDDLTRELIPLREVSYEELIHTCDTLVSGQCDTLRRPEFSEPKM